MKLLSKFLTASIAAGAMMAAATAANATVTFTPINLIGGSSIYGATTDEDGLFTHEFEFTTTEGGKASSSVVTISLEGDRDIDFTSIDLDGVAFTPKSPDPAESWGLPLTFLGAGTHKITLSGTLQPGDPEVAASYAGTLNIVAGVIPEPATWGLMIVGFGGAGAMVRSRRRQLVRA